MFQLIKQNVSLAEVIRKDLKVELHPVGSSNLAIVDEKDNGGCPFCHHFDCFRVKIAGEDSENPDGHSEEMYKCFSCGAHGDVFKWRVERAGGEDNLSYRDAALELAKEFNIDVPISAHNPIQAIFNASAGYYHEYLMSCTTKYAELGGLTPLEYQMNVRGHSKAVLSKYKVGFSDGNLYEYLEGTGYDMEMLLESGIINKKTEKDFLPAKCFIYPHFVQKQVSHFTFKDPTKRLEYQLGKKHSLNGYLFYGQDTLAESTTVIVVEGENDFLSCIEAGAQSVLAIIGQISTEQLNWMRENLSAKKVVTIFDGDDAGDLYRKKVEKLRRYFGNLAHVRPPQGSDVDEQIQKAKKSLPEIVKEGIVKVSLEEAEVEKPSLDLGVPWEEVSDAPVAPKTPAESPFSPPVAEAKTVESITELMKGSGLELPSANTMKEAVEVCEEVVELEDSPIIQSKGCYWKTTFKDGQPSYTRISDFVLRLKNVFINESGERSRELIAIKRNGYVSNPFVASDDDKVYMRSFRKLMAKVADAEWSGSEADMIGMWRLVYHQDNEVHVQVPRAVGRIDKYRCWVFQNCLITDSGVVIEPDEDGIFWTNGKTQGIRPESLSSSSALTPGLNHDAPPIRIGISDEEYDDLIGTAVKMLAQNLNGEKPMLAESLMMMGWCWATVYSDLIFKYNRGFPFLMLWGPNGKGKTTLAKWLQRFFGIEDHCSTSVSQLKSGVGWSRKAEYYSCLPLIVDEIRSDEATRQYLGMFRAYYDREGRTLGTKSDFGVRTTAAKATFIFCGEDQFEDPATRERCIPVRIPSVGRETSESYKWFEDRRHLFSGVTFKRILEACSINQNDVMTGINALDKELLASGCPPRISKNRAAVGYFANILAERYFPGFDFKAEMIAQALVDTTTQKEENTLSQFYELLETTQAQENSPITSEHVGVEGKFLHLWYPALYRIVQDVSRGGLKFSKNAVLNAIREEPYFVGESRVNLGLGGTRRRVIDLDLDKCPEALKNLAREN